MKLSTVHALLLPVLAIICLSGTYAEEARQLYHSKGSKGYSASKGYSKGSKGYSDSKGSKGYSASKGYSKGYSKGSKGYSDSKGSKGYSKGYSKGSKGYSDSKGSKGYSASKGYSKGSKGYSYSKGSKGYSASKGSKGSKGAYSYGDRACKDSTSFEFKTEFSGYEDCAWLSEKQFRQRKYCLTFGYKNEGDTKVKFMCRRSCANYLNAEKYSRCFEHQDTDTFYDDDGVDDPNCADDMDFQFETENVDAKDCEWLSQKTVRKSKYCETRGWDDSSDIKVKFACKKSCNNC